MKPGVILFVVRDLTAYLVDNDMLLEDGTVDFSDITEDVGIVAVVEKSLKAHGVTVPEQIDKVIQALPLLLSFLR